MSTGCVSDFAPTVKGKRGKGPRTAAERRKLRIEAEHLRGKSRRANGVLVGSKRADARAAKAAPSLTG